MEITKVRLEDIVPAEVNVRVHPKRQIQEYARSIEMYGQMKPIVLDEENNILAGNGLYLALSEMGAEEADCYIAKGLTEQQKKKFILSDNRVFELGIQDQKGVDALLADLEGDIDIPGFDEELLSVLYGSVASINEAIGSYGKFDEEDVARNIKQTTAPEPVSGSANDTPTAAEYVAAGGKVPERESVICPRCGEVVWLQ